MLLVARLLGLLLLLILGLLLRVLLLLRLCVLLWLCVLLGLLLLFLLWFLLFLNCERGNDRAQRHEQYCRSDRRKCFHLILPQLHTRRAGRSLTVSF